MPYKINTLKCKLNKDLMSPSKYTDVNIPDLGYPKTEPKIVGSTYQTRLEKLFDKADTNSFNSLIIYGDREHFANLAYLTGYDPRFEESMLVMDVSTRKITLMMGHEGLGYFPVSPVKESIRSVLYPSFSLMGQDRGKTSPLDDLLEDAGVKERDKVGVIGWKYFNLSETRTPDHWLEIPSFIVDTLRTMVGHGNVVNANSLLMHQEKGLRAVNEAEQLASFEYAATITSQSIKNMIFGLKPGMTEFDAVRLMKIAGLPQSCHLMLSAGPRAFMGLASPSSRVITEGDPITVAYGVFGALNCRAGWVLEDENELPSETRDYVDKLVKPYFEAIADWYSHLGIGVSGGVLYDAIHQRLRDPFFGVHLNPGHLIHLEEWLNSPIYIGSKDKLLSGMALQVDVIPATGTPYFTTNMEDGIALADLKLREELSSSYPECWERILKRRSFMEELGFKLKPEALPFSNLSGYLPPFMLSPHKAIRLG